MHPDRFDRHIKSKIYPAESPVPTGMWDQIEASIRPRRNRRWIWYFLGAGLVVALVSVATMDLNPASHAMQTNASIPPLTAANAVAVNEEVTGEKKIPANASAPESAQTTKRVKANEQVDMATLGATGQSNAAAIAAAPTTVQEPPRPPQAATTVSQRSPAFQDRLSRSSLANARPGVSAPYPSKRAPAMRERVQARSPWAALHPIQTGLAILDGPSRHISIDPDVFACPSFKGGGRFRPFVELSLLGGIPHKALTLLDQESTSYRDLRTSTEKVRSVWSVQGAVGVEFGKNWDVSAGLGLTQIHEVFDYFDESASRTVVNIVTDTIFQNGVPIVYSDTSIVTEFGKHIKLSHNRLTYFDVPVMVGYRFQVKKHQLHVRAGAMINLAFWKRGDLLAPDEQIISLDPKAGQAASVFRSSTGFDLVGSLGYLLDLSERNTLSFLLSVRAPVKSITVDGYPLDQKYTHFNLGVAFRHRL